MKVLAVVLLTVGTAAPLLVAQGVAPASGVGGITPGAMIGLAATWLGIGIGYLNLRRTIRRDAEEQMNAVATKVAHNVVTARAMSFMDKGRQEEINAKNDERYELLLAMQERRRGGGAG